MNAATPTTYQTQAQATRRRRQAAGKYRRPTRSQIDALRKYSSGVGVQAMTAEECVLLGGHPYLTPGQRTEWMGRAFAKGWR